MIRLNLRRARILSQSDPRYPDTRCHMIIRKTSPSPRRNYLIMHHFLFDPNEGNTASPCVGAFRPLSSASSGAPPGSSWRFREELWLSPVPRQGELVSPFLMACCRTIFLLTSFLRLASAHWHDGSQGKRNFGNRHGLDHEPICDSLPFNPLDFFFISAVLDDFSTGNSAVEAFVHLLPGGFDRWTKLPAS